MPLYVVTGVVQVRVATTVRAESSHEAELQARQRSIELWADSVKPFEHFYVDGSQAPVLPNMLVVEEI